MSRQTSLVSPNAGAIDNECFINVVLWIVDGARISGVDEFDRNAIANQHVIIDIDSNGAIEGTVD